MVASVPKPRCYGLKPPRSSLPMIVGLIQPNEVRFIGTNEEYLRVDPHSTTSKAGNWLFGSRSVQFSGKLIGEANNYAASGNGLRKCQSRRA